MLARLVDIKAKRAARVQELTALLLPALMELEAIEAAMDTEAVGVCADYRTDFPTLKLTFEAKYDDDNDDEDLVPLAQMVQIIGAIKEDAADAMPRAASPAPLAPAEPVPMLAAEPMPVLPAEPVPMLPAEPVFMPLAEPIPVAG